jgi:aryl-alcohol dehydrogenase-like predicted oxidoreductase
MARLGVGRLDLMYAHISDPAVPLSETVEGFAEPVSSGFAGLSPDGEPGAAGPDLLSYVRSTGLPLVAYSPLLSGAYVRPDKPLGPEFFSCGDTAAAGGFVRRG